ncbi:hypothetical protein ARMSODRAFT_1031008 [Armillaria solidipes]|uniref:Uncharacterized protein n=1 Tax=Armillaria solidipes TaxID=1076256 RepID=A0A2H3C6I4_9AGAR|nr:hypothetical protein ARMSODRAFT_1031008 [Armillaria solidipes]
MSTSQIYYSDGSGICHRETESLRSGVRSSSSLRGTLVNEIVGCTTSAMSSDGTALDSETLKTGNALPPGTIAFLRDSGISLCRLAALCEALVKVVRTGSFIAGKQKLRARFEIVVPELLPGIILVVVLIPESACSRRNYLGVGRNSQLVVSPGI